MDFINYGGYVKEFCIDMEKRVIPELRGINDGKKVGTYFEHEIKKFLEKKLGKPLGGSSAAGKDIPAFNIDVKTTSIQQPQSSSPFTDASEQVFGLPYNILLFIYQKSDTVIGATFKIISCCYIPQDKTGDHRITKEILNLLSKLKNMEITDNEFKEAVERKLQIKGAKLADGIIEKIKTNPPQLGAITITPAIQWRLNYNKFKNIVPPEGSLKFY